MPSVIGGLTSGMGSGIEPNPAVLAKPARVKVTQPPNSTTSRNWFELGQALVGPGKQVDVPIAGTGAHGVQPQKLQKTTKGVFGAQDTFMLMVTGVLIVSGAHDELLGSPPGVIQ